LEIELRRKGVIRAKFFRETGERALYRSYAEGNLSGKKKKWQAK